ncbi:MAG: two component transcriptional regulator, winged helix family [Pedosphaera sp.]|nr:two component transcriptional regulator, winged helix family [Pedosphaera sp.]
MKLKVLVAEHEAGLLAVAASSLETGGYQVISAINGLQALKQACASLPDLIILDALLPDIDGRAVCEILHRLPSTAHIPILMLSGSPGKEPDMIGSESWADGYITKPLIATQLVLRANEILMRMGETHLPGSHLESAYPLAGYEP